MKLLNASRWLIVFCIGDLNWAINTLGITLLGGITPVINSFELPHLHS